MYNSGDFRFANIEIAATKKQDLKKKREIYHTGVMFFIQFALLRHALKKIQLRDNVLFEKRNATEDLGGFENVSHQVFSKVANSTGEAFAEGEASNVYRRDVQCCPSRGL